MKGAGAAGPSAGQPFGSSAGGLRTDQAPPLSIPVSFFLLAPLAMITSGVLLASSEGVLASRWVPLAMAATHLGTLGFLGALMLGAIYQMIPVVAGVPVPWVRLAHGVHALFAAGLGLLVAGLASGEPALLVVGPIVLLAALVLFLAPVVRALMRAPAKNETVHGMRLAVLGLVVVVILGVTMALGRAGLVQVGGDWLGWVSAHAAMGGVVWIGGLITAVSWQVVPMFYLTPPSPPWTRRATLAAMSLALVAVPVGLVGGGGPTPIFFAALPALVMVWWVHPVVTLMAIGRRRRRRVDGSVRFWWAGLALAPLVPVLAAGALWGSDQRWAVALGWWLVWGWAGLIGHGMLTRIVPFLVWFHRYSALVGVAPVPSMRALMPDAHIRLALWLHLGAFATGALALVSGSALMARAAGALLVVTGLMLALNLVRTLRARPLGSAGASPDQASSPSSSGASLTSF